MSDTPGAAAAGLPSGQSWDLQAVRVLAWLLLTAAFLRTAWIGDDALITLRHSLNLAHGWGPGFNATESVLGATHPLWFLLWTLAGSVTNYWILSNFVLSILFSSAAVALLLWTAKRVLVVIGASIALLLSSAFVDYTSSGLENPLAMFIVGLIILQSRESSSRSYAHTTLLGLTVAALILTRPDLMVLIVPVGLWSIWRLRMSPKSLVVAALAFSVPVGAWITWSWSAYHSIFPNTLAAKSNLDIPRLDLLVQGSRYLMVSVQQDWVSGLVLLIGGITVLWLGSAWQRFWMVGVAAYLSYVVWIGGDFMVGRFLAIPIYVTVFLLATLSGRGKQVTPTAINYGRIAVGGIAATVVVALLVGPVPTSLTRDPGQRWSGSFGIADERGVYSELGRTLHVYLGERVDVPGFTFVSASEANPWGRISDYEGAARNWPTNNQERLRRPDEVGTVCWLGATALVTGPRVHWIDTCALTDRFLASMPSGGGDWRIGHFKRSVPEGYSDAILLNDASLIQSPELRRELNELWTRIK